MQLVSWIALWFLVVSWEWKFVLGLLRKIVSVGRVAEPAPPAPDPAPADLAARAKALRGSAQVRCVDAGSCNGCEIEIGQAFGPVYDAERYGARVVASPRHADVLLVTGPVTRNMAGPLRSTYEAAAEPRVVVAVGDCAIDCGVFAGAYGVQGAVDEVVPVDLRVPGCPPEPDAIIRALRQVTGR
jgi:Ni,Fe-hydrogenase III small subunit